MATKGLMLEVKGDGKGDVACVEALYRSSDGSGVHAVWIVRPAMIEPALAPT